MFDYRPSTSLPSGMLRTVAETKDANVPLIQIVNLNGWPLITVMMYPRQTWVQHQYCDGSPSIAATVDAFILTSDPHLVYWSVFRPTTTACVSTAPFHLFPPQADQSLQIVCNFLWVQILKRTEVQLNSLLFLPWLQPLILEEYKLHVL